MVPRKTDGFLAVMPGRLVAMKFGKKTRCENHRQIAALDAIFSDGSQRHRVRSVIGTLNYPWSAGI
jgi:hypothetical protein